MKFPIRVSILGSESYIYSGNDSRGSPTEMDMAALEDAMQDQSSGNTEHTHIEPESHQNVMSSSSLDLENRLLKNEISSLNQEMASLVQRAKESETGKHLLSLSEKLISSVWSKLAAFLRF
mgnify:CR=1 FL=1